MSTTLEKSTPAKTTSIKSLQDKAKYVRQELFKFKTDSKVGHLATCLSTVDVLVSLYYDEAAVFDPNKDEIIFSKGHGAPAVYPILADLGYIDKAELAKYGRKGGMLRMHCDASIPQCQFIGGSLGNGIGYAAGRGFEQGNDTYVVLGDGELYEGSVWETLMFIAHHNLYSQRLIIDRNELCILGNTEEIIRLEPLAEKFKAFGFDVAEIDGHDFEQMREVFSKKPSRPQVIIANTVKGKGVSYMEGKWEYHTIIPKDPEQIRIGKEDLA